MVENAEWLSLDAGEEMVWSGGPRLRRTLPTVARSTAWALAFLAVAVVGPRFAPASVPDLAVVGGGVLLALASGRTAAMAYLRTTNTDYVLTNRSVYEKRGVWSTNVTRVGVANVQNTRLEKSVWGNLFDYGTVAVSTAGSSGDDLVVTDLNDPETFRNELQRLTSAAGSPPTGAAPSGGSLDAAAVDALLPEARSMRAAAERVEREVVEG
ncbi:MAG: PH domain-containing protein [Haloferacaceae archaeon]